MLPYIYVYNVMHTCVMLCVYVTTSTELLVHCHYLFVSLFLVVLNAYIYIFHHGSASDSECLKVSQFDL